MNKLLTFSLTLLLTTTCLFGQDVTIHQIQYTDSPSGNSPYEGQTVSTGGVVIGVNYTNQPIRYFISDPGGGLWNGILINDNQDRGLAIGDSIRFQAQVQESNGQTRLRNIVSGTFVMGQHGDLISPALINSGEIGESAEGVLIELTDAIVTSVGVSDFVVNDGSGPITIGTGWSFAYEPLVGDTLRYLRGIVTSVGSVYTLNPRSDSDFGFFGNRPPLFSDVQNSPATPTDLQSDTISALITDESGIGAAKVYYRFGEEGEYLERSMYDDGTNGDRIAGDGRWTSVIPAGPARQYCYYYIWAADNLGASSTSPVDAPAATYSYIIRSSVLSIFDLQYTGNPSGGSSPYVDQIVTVTGIVTGTEYGDNRDGFFFTDPGGGLWSGILVFGPNLTPALGDCVRVRGQVTEYYELTEFTSGNEVTILGQGVVPDPLPLRIGQMADSAEAYEGTLCQIGACVVTNTSDWLQYRQFDVRDQTGTGTVLGDFAFEYVPVVGDSFTFITGCVTYHSAVGWMIAPRSDSDMGIVDRRPPTIVSVTAVTDTTINIVFDERLSPDGISDPANYRIVDQSDTTFPELHVLSAYLFSTGKTIQLTVFENLNHRYQLTINAVQDIAGNVLANSVVGVDGYEPTEYELISSLYNDFDSYDGAIVALRGIVTFVQDVTTTSGSRRISAFMQDESGYGFSLSQTGAASTFPGIQRGNLILIYGVVTAYQGTIQLGSFNGDPTAGDIVVLAENQPLPAPIQVATGDRLRQQQIVHTSSPNNYGAGTWCQVTGVPFQIDENVGGGTNIYFDDGTGSTVIRIWDSMNLHTVILGEQTYRIRDLLGVRCSIAGPASTYNGDFQMLAGYAEDFSLPTVTPPDTSSEELYKLRLDVPNRPFAPDLGQKLKISYSGPVVGQLRLRVFDLRGRLVTTLVDKKSGGPDEIMWDGRDELRNLLPLGTYILHLESVRDGKSDTKVKPIVIGTRL